jgi:uncharacterized protein YecE (DUF72 family)
LSAHATAEFDYRIGLPAWAFPGWRGEYFPPSGNPLSHYARVFNIVEGNTTFYALPEVGTVQSWADAVAEHEFQFAFKLPKEVTHQRSPDLALLTRFPAWVDERALHAFTPVFDLLQQHHRVDKGPALVIEMRHPQWFETPERLEPWLERYRASRVQMDTRPLYQGNVQHPEVQQAMHEKPNVPVLQTVYNNLAFIRLVLHPDECSNERWLEEWADTVSEQLHAGVQVNMLIHCPNNAHCPRFAEDFHLRLRRRNGMQTLPTLPPWCVPQQGTLF